MKSETYLTGSVILMKISDKPFSSRYGRLGLDGTLCSLLVIYRDTSNNLSSLEKAPIVHGSFPFVRL